MTLEDQGSDTENVVETTQTQGDSADTSTETTEATEGDESEAVEVEEVEVDYKTVSEKLEKDNTGRQDKINKQRAALAQSNQKIQDLQTQLTAMQTVDAPKEPVIDDYETHDEYVNALTDHRVEQRVKDSQEQFIADQKTRLEQDKAKVEQDTFLKQEHEYRIANPTYDNSKSELQAHMAAYPTNPMVADAIYEQAGSGGGVAEMINYFGEDGGANLAEFDRIASLTPVQAAVEVYKIQQKLKAVSPKTETKTQTKPVKVAKGSSNRSKPVSNRDGRGVIDWLNEK